MLNKRRAVKDSVILKARSRGLVFYAAENPDRPFRCEKLRLKAGPGGEGRTPEGSQKPRRSMVSAKAAGGQQPRKREERPCGAQGWGVD